MFVAPSETATAPARALIATQKCSYRAGNALIDLGWLRRRHQRACNGNTGFYMESPPDGGELLPADELRMAPSADAAAG
jgi:hypothetical protein